MTNTIKPYQNLSLDNMPGEIWKSIDHFDGLYEISNLGRVKSLSRSVNVGGGGVRVIRERILKPSIKYNQLRVALYDERLTKSKSISRLVASHFLKNPKPKEYDYVFHRNKNHMDNRADNLFYGSPDYISKIARENQKKVLYAPKSANYCSKTKYLGVYELKTFQMRIYVKGKTITRNFATKEEAAKEYNKIIEKYNLNIEKNCV